MDFEKGKTDKFTKLEKEVKLKEVSIAEKLTKLEEDVKKLKEDVKKLKETSY